MKTKILIWYEILCQITTYKYIIILTLSVLLGISVSYLRIKNYEEKLSNYQIELLKTKEAENVISVYSEFKKTILLKPSFNSIICEGVENKVGNKSTISILENKFFENTINSNNPLLSIFLSYDFVDLIINVYGLFVILLTCTIITNE